MCYFFSLKVNLGRLDGSGKNAKYLNENKNRHILLELALIIQRVCVKIDVSYPKAFACSDPTINVPGRLVDYLVSITSPQEFGSCTS